MSERGRVDAVTIDVGGLPMRLSGLDEGLAQAVRARYGRFLTDAAPVFTLALTVLADAPHAPADPIVDVTGDRRYRVRYGALEADLDVAGGQGRATVLPTVYLVDSLLRITTTLVALEHDALLLHASGVKLGAEVLVCFGPSGVGKTTTARSVPREDVLCDEMMLVRADGAAAGTPFHGDLDFCQPGSGPALALVRLHQAPGEALEPLQGARAARALLGSVLFFAQDEALSARVLDLALRICPGRTYHLAFTRETHVPTYVHAHLRRDAA